MRNARANLGYISIRAVSRSKLATAQHTLPWPDHTNSTVSNFVFHENMELVGWGWEREDGHYTEGQTLAEYLLRVEHHVRHQEHEDGHDTVPSHEGALFWTTKGSRHINR